MDPPAPPKPTLRLRLLLVVLVAVVPTIAALAYEVGYLRQRAAGEVEHNAARLTRIVSLEQEQVLHGTRQALFLLARLAEVRSPQPGGCDGFLAGLLPVFPHALNLGLIELEGNVSCSALPQPEPLNLGDRAYFRRALATRDFAVGDYQVGRITGQPSLNVAIPVLSAAGDVERVLFAALSLDWLDRVVESWTLPSGAEVLLWDREGTVLAHHPAGTQWRGRTLPAAFLASVRDIAPGRAAVRPGTDGRNRLFSVVALGPTGLPDTIWLAIGVPPEAVFRLGQRLGRLLLVSALVGLVAAGAAWVWADRLIIAPASLLVHAAHRLRQGDLSVRVGPPYPDGEIGDLAQVFDAATAALERRYGQVRALAQSAGRLTQHLEREAVLEAISTEAQRVFQADAAGVRLADPESGDWRTVAGSGLSGAYSQTTVPAAAVGRLIRPNGDVVPLPELAQAVPERAAAYAAEGLRSALLAPLLQEGRTVGGLTIYSRLPRVFDTDEEALAATFAGQAAAALQNAAMLGDATRRLRHLEALRAIDVAVAASPELEPAMQVVLEQVTDQLGVAAAALLLPERGSRLTWAVVRGIQEGLPARPLAGRPDPAGRALRERRLQLVADLAAAPDFPGRAALLGAGFRSCLDLPLLFGGEARGVLEIYHTAELRPSQEWLSFAETLAGQAALALNAAHLFADLQESNARLVAAYDATLRGWSRALDLRDQETEGHSRRVTVATVRLARKLRIAGEEIVHMRRGALLHDIGKIAIPDAILRKPGPLSDAEWAVMKRHPEVARDLLRPIEFLRPALDIPYCHHEKWDGSGYPRGLRGEEIPLAARLFAVVDVWDALRSDRPYRKAWPLEQVRRHMAEQSGRHFDPQVVELFLTSKPLHW